MKCGAKIIRACGLAAALTGIFTGPAVAAEPSGSSATIAHPREAMQHASGLWVVLGVQDAQLLIDLAESTAGKALIQGLSTDAQVVGNIRQQLAEKGLIPLVDVRHVPSYEHLPYTNELATVVVVNEPGLAGHAISEAELDRVRFFTRPLVRGSGSQWTMTSQPMPADVDEWRHALYGPERIPLSSDERVGPWITGLRFMVGDEAVSGTQNRTVSRATRLAGGRMFVRGLRPAGNKKSTTVVRALDAGNGLPLWEREIVPAQSDQNTYVPRQDDILGFFNSEGPMQRLDAATGEVLATYDQGVSLKFGTYQVAKGEYGKKGLIDVEGTLKNDTIEIFDLGDTVIQVYDGRVVKLDIATGKKIWEYSYPKAHFAKSAMGRDGHVYLIPCETRWVDRAGKRHHNPAIATLSLDGVTGKKRWEMPFGDRVMFPTEFAGAADGHLVFTTYWLEEGAGFKRMGTNYLFLLNAEDGSVVQEKKVGSVRHKTFIMDGEWFGTHSYKAFAFKDLASGAVLRDCDVYGQPGGCGLPTFTPKYIIRGQMFHLRENPVEAFAASGFRPHCESPMMPGYGSLYSGQSGTCGCAWYLPTSYVKAGTFYEQPDVVQRTQAAASTVLPRLSTAPTGPIAARWPITKYQAGNTKGERAAHIPAPAKKRVNDSLNRFNKKGLHWYGFGAVPELSVGDMIYRVDVHHQRLTALQGESEQWTAVLDGRISTAPIFVDGVLIAATHAGAVYGLDPATGSTKWRTLVAPNAQQMVAFAQLESLWPCYGVIEHEGAVLTIAGRISSLDSGFYAASMDPATGELNWRVRQAVEPVKFTDVSKQIPGGRGWGTKRGSHTGGQPFSRAYMSLNSPPMVTNNHLHAAGMIMVDLKDPKPFRFSIADEVIDKLPDLPD